MRIGKSLLIKLLLENLIFILSFTPNLILILIFSPSNFHHTHVVKGYYFCQLTKKAQLK